MEKKSKKSLIIGLTSLFLVMLILVGLTYAYYRTRIIGNNSNEPSISVQSKKMEITYHDGNAVLSTEGLIEPGFTATKEFSVENTGTETSTFSIMLDNVVNEYNKDTTRGEYNDWKYYLYSGSVVNPDNLIKEGEITTDAVQYIVDSVSINASETKNYIIKVEYKDLEDIDQSLDMGSKFSLRVNIGDEHVNANPFTEGTLAYAILNRNNVEEPKTIPGQSVSAADEAVLSSTEDDYGTSYYFRGNVENNYVNYAGMCWRIVRIEGDGSVKLILEDRNEQCNDKEGQDLNNNGTYFTGNWSDGNTYAFGYDSNYKADFFNYTDRNGLQDSFKTFQTSKLTTTDIEKLKVDEWCFDRSVTSVNENCYDYNEDGVDDECYTVEYYGAHTRIFTNKKPSLKCTGTKLTEFKDETDMYVGTLTAEEMSFAGATTSPNYNYYLVNTYEKDNDLYWWSLSPDSFDGEVGGGYAFRLYDGGHLNYHDVFVGIYSRPAVSLKSGSVITDGEGTLEKPYIIG